MSLDVTLQPVRTETVPLKRAILHTLSYADIFEYPLTVLEIHRYLTAQRATAQQVARALDEMTAACAVVRLGEFFALYGRDAIIGIRDRRAGMAAGIWRAARRYGRIIASLPFVRMVAVTGSLSMSNADRGTDIDLMLVSEPGHLWTCRALVLLVARFARLEGVQLCPNYIVTTNALEFRERSLYVAHEVAQMIPLSGLDIYYRIRRGNDWTDAYLPNAQGLPEPAPEARRSPRWQRLLEASLKALPFAWFEAWEMKRKIRRLSREQAFSPEAYFSADVCKGHMDRHKERTEALLEERLEGLNTL